MSDRPWMNRALTSEARAALVLGEMTREEKLILVNGHIGNPSPNLPKPPDGGMGSAGFVQGVERLGIPFQQQTDASLGVANLHDGVGSTALPSGLAQAASWDEALVEAGGAMIGAEARAKGFNVMLAGGVNLTREPRCGRNFEYLGEDPLLAGVLVGASLRGIQSNHLVATIKHFALNAQETGRMVLSAEIDEAALRESDLLAFEIGIERGRPGSVMTAYNRINQTYAAEHDFLLGQVLKGEWAYPGYVMSDWGGCHSTEASALAGLDQESGQEIDKEPYYQALGEAIDAGRLPAARLDEMVGRILWAMFEHGLFDHPNQPGEAIDREAHLDAAQRAAEAGIVLLKNDGLLPLSREVGSIAVIGFSADIGVLSGGGSSSVVPWDGFARAFKPESNSRWASYLRQRYLPSSPLKTLQAAAPDAAMRFNDGTDVAAAAALAAQCEVAIVFAEQWTSEFIDVPGLSLPNGQEALIEAVAKANPNLVVVLETGGPVTMPWLDQVPAVLEAWYPGGRGAEAIGAVLFGEVNPSGRLPLSFPRSEADTPNPVLPGIEQERGKFDVTYPEGADVGYRWYARTGRPPLFPFGHGLSYTSFAYANLVVDDGEALAVSLDVTNTGERAGADVVQLYLTEADGRPTSRLLGWAKVFLEPGETKSVTIAAEPRLLADWDLDAGGWRIADGAYGIAIATSATTPVLRAEARLSGADV
ncbi:MAG TPA: glycoside hydrolase family 3 C-terminal domain-containing protein [Caulobacteraceae bacterium]|jgi:beta-glucosidase|nr:glycoside hydrolase family 3 C-terminal domain-containing protein [Caulobacteraceae bacterium]